MLAISNDELGEPLGKTIKCPRCGRRHKITTPQKRTWDQQHGYWGITEPGFLQFFRCNGASYLCGINGRTINP